MAAPARPDLRERLLRLGPRRLSECELVAVVLGTGTRRRGAAAIAGELLARAGGLAGLTRMPRQALAEEEGIGAARACRLLAAIEIGRRLAGPGPSRPRIGCPDDAARELRALVGERRERLVGLYLDAAGGLLARETIAVGSLNVTRAEGREVLEPALRHGAASLILAHNHPSGRPDPSEADHTFTVEIARAARVMGVTLLDHLILATGGVTSLRERGLVWEGIDPAGARARDPAAAPGAGGAGGYTPRPPRRRAARRGEGSGARRRTRGST